MRRATTLEEIYQALGPKPLRIDELDEFFVETSQARDPHVSRRRQIKRLLRREDENVKILLAGHAGSGKSTELTRIRKDLEKDFSFIQLSISEDGNLGHMTIESLLVLIIEAVLCRLAELDLEIDESLAENIYQWFTTTLSIKEDDWKLTGSAGAGADTKATWWGKLLGVSAYLKMDVKTGSRS